MQLIVEYTQDLKEAALEEWGTVKYRLPLINAYVIELPAEHVNSLRGMKSIKAVYETSNITAQMNLARKTVKADSPALREYTGRGITIAILDTGLSLSEDFAKPRNRLLFFRDFAVGNVECYDDNGHGTHKGSWRA